MVAPAGGLLPTGAAGAMGLVEESVVEGCGVAGWGEPSAISLTASPALPAAIVESEGVSSALNAKPPQNISTMRDLATTQQERQAARCGARLSLSEIDRCSRAKVRPSQRPLIAVPDCRDWK